jgi:threonine dehydratase
MSQALYGRTEGKKRALTLAEAIGVKTPGILPQAILPDLLEDIIVVKEEEIERAVDLFLSQQKIVVEGGGAAGLAGFLHAPTLFNHKQVGIVVSGGNIEGRLLSAIMMRRKIRDGLLAFLRIEIPDMPGELSHVTQIIANFQGNIIDVKHQRLFYEIPIKMADVDIMVETFGTDHTNSIINALETAGYKVNKLSGKALS